MKSAYCFGILILIANLLVINYFGTDVPFWDQWDSEAQLYIKWENKSLTLEDMIKPHVQHRFAVSRVLRIVLFEIFGGWSPMKNMIAQSFFVPLIFLIFFRMVQDRLVAQWKKNVFYSLSVVVFIVPFYWEVMLLGFQSHLYLSIIFALVLIKLSTNVPRFPHLLGFSAIGLAAIFTSASSLIALLVSLIAQLMAMAGFKQYKHRLSFWMIGVNVLLILLSALLLVFPEDHQKYGAHGIADLLWLSLQAFSWPVEYVGIICLWLIPVAIVVKAHQAWTPQGLKAVVACIVRDRTNLAIFSFLLWLMLSIVSIAYARGNYALFVSRYLNIYAFTLFVPFLLYLLFIDGVVTFFIKKPLAAIITGIYCLLAIGLTKEFIQEWQRCRQYKVDMDIIKTNLITAMEQKNPRHLYEQQKIKSIYGAHPDPGKVFQIMNHESLQGKHLWLSTRKNNNAK